MKQITKINCINSYLLGFLQLKEKSSKKAKDVQQTVPQEADQAEATVSKTTTSSVNGMYFFKNI